MTPETIRVTWFCFKCQRSFKTIDPIVDGKIMPRRCDSCGTVLAPPELIMEPEPMPAQQPPLVAVQTEPVPYSSVEITASGKPVVKVYDSDVDRAAQECLRVWRGMCEELAHGKPATKEKAMGL